MPERQNPVGVPLAGFASSKKCEPVCTASRDGDVLLEQVVCATTCVGVVARSGGRVGGAVGVDAELARGSPKIVRGPIGQSIGEIAVGDEFLRQRRGRDGEESAGGDKEANVSG